MELLLYKQCQSAAKLKNDLQALPLENLHVGCGLNFILLKSDSLVFLLNQNSCSARSHLSSVKEELKLLDAASVSFIKGKQPLNC